MHRLLSTWHWALLDSVLCLCAKIVFTGVFTSWKSLGFCDLQGRAFGQDFIKGCGMEWGLWEMDAWVGQRTDGMIQVHNSNTEQIWIVLYNNTSKEVYIPSGATSFLWDCTWLNFYLKFNSNDLIIGIVDFEFCLSFKGRFVHLNDSLMVFSLYWMLIFLYMPASTIIYLQEVLNFRMFGSYLSCISLTLIYIVSVKSKISGVWLNSKKGNFS